MTVAGVSDIVDLVPAATSVRHPAPADEQAFVTAVRASRQLHTPFIEPPDSHVRFAQYLDRISRPEHAGFLVIDLADGELAGFININEIVLGAFASAYLGYAAFAGRTGRGLMSDGLTQVVGIAFDVMGLHRLEANIQPSNTPSISLVTRLGFRHEGFSPRYLHVAGAWRDHERFALTVEDWADRGLASHCGMTARQAGRQTAAGIPSSAAAGPVAEPGRGQSRGGQVGTWPRPDGNRMFFERTNSCSVSTAFSRPKPLPFTPPNGEPRKARACSC